GLMVSGHTHGGQVVLARIFGVVITPAALLSGYVEGLYRIDGTQLYVTRGIGMVGIPIRINCPPEISVLTLV
ncbi:MAG: metallophosphoesterase, partial [Bacteroidetes bacterium]|nr:metallophosphoesterase [Bacteroidota bacterium]